MATYTYSGSHLPISRANNVCLIIIIIRIEVMVWLVIPEVMAEGYRFITPSCPKYMYKLTNPLLQPPSYGGPDTRI